MTMYQWNGDVLTEWKYLQDKLESRRAEWEAFMKTGRSTGESNIAPEILSSWQRCKDRGLNPYDDSIVVLSKQQLEQRLEKNKAFIEMIRPILQETADSIKDSGYRIDLYDKDLYCIGRFGKKLGEGDVERRKVILGESHKESDTGTNATNLAALLEKPVTVMAYEHYRTSLHSLTCISAPIMDKENNLLAVLTVEGFIWPLHKHTMALLIALKYNIEDRISRNYKSEAKLVEQVNSELLEMTPDAVVVADATGKIVMANSAAYSSILDGWDNVIGFSCENIWGYRTPIYDVMKEKRPIMNRILNVGNKKYYANIKPVIDNDDELSGVIITVKNPDDKSNMQKNCTGLRAHYTFENICGESNEIKQAIRLAKETAQMDSNILISGESGTGKELFAESIHNSSYYSSGPFVAVNCSAIPNSLLESELFGYDGGSFTGAKKEGSIGKFERAIGGTIFLDEINSMSLEMQAKILRVIQNKSVMHVGGTEEIPVNVRIISATNIDLWQMVKEGSFREDLYYRINVISINVPPLRDRQGDIGVLIRDLLSKLSSRLKQEVKIDREAIDILKEYSWPGNVRELENVLERSWVVAKTNGADHITAEDILSYRGIEEERINGQNTETQTDEASAKKEDSSFDEAERKLIIETLEKKKGNIQATAKSLGIARNTLYRKMKKFEIEHKGRNKD